MKAFNQKIHLVNHLKKKKSCPPSNVEEAPPSTESLLEDLLNPYKKNVAAIEEQPQPQPQPVAPAMITNSGGINFFIFPGLNGTDSGETKILSSVNFNDIGTAINSLLGFIVSQQPPHKLLADSDSSFNNVP